ncbi:PLP-dependent aminotransferase family protein [Treponema brennaborense]|uniref:Transcriptional regulator, GntR family n=1 Tax=Treponema brennaborense (strain DSM 12168 / CIP 105900 / DD5/3) TaxID=906968 RepID=F4LME3_TREBD|nr:PLP-dependent aminotransferase family protein [Treponema brennaborense]AEE15705.1 transcriptional regulator, GntR family [Treponema brennaborense DSM 12168]
MLPTAFVYDHTSSEPLYRQLSAHLAALIRSGAFSKTDRLPSVRDLAGFADVSRNTAAAAYALLEAQGYVSAKSRSGFRTATPNDFVFPQTDRAPFVYPAAPDAAAAAVLDISTGTPEGTAAAERAAAGVLRKLYRAVLADPDTDIYLKRGDPSGEPQLRRALARYLSDRRGVVCSEDQILIGAGTEYVLQTAVRILQARTGRQSIYAVEEPGSDPIRKIFDDALTPAESEFSADQHGRTVGIPVDGNGISVDLLGSSGADIVCVTPAHQFPTGSSMNLERKAELLRWAYKTPNRYIIEDSYDSDYYYAAAQPAALQSMDSQGRVLYFGTFAQMTVPSMQTAYLVLPPQLVHLFRRQFSYYSCTVPLLEQRAVTAFLKDGHAEKLAARARKFNRQRRAFCTAQFEREMPGAVIIGGKTGTHFLVELPEPVNAERFAEQLRRNGITAQLVQTVRNAAGQPQIAEKPQTVATRQTQTEGQTQTVAFIVKYPFLTEDECRFAARTAAAVYLQTRSTIPLEE